MTSDNESTIDTLISLGNAQQRVASYNTVQQSAQLTLKRRTYWWYTRSPQSSLCIQNKEIIVCFF